MLPDAGLQRCSCQSLRHCLVGIANRMVKGYFGNIADQTASIHRFIRLQHFTDFIRGTLVLVRPSAWDDPFEVLAQRSMVIDKRYSPWKEYPISAVMENVFGQSWSLNEDSDTYLRAYSSVRKDLSGRNADAGFESVRITTTPRKLQGAIELALSSSSTFGEAFVFTCGVKYVHGDSIRAAVGSTVNRVTVTSFDRAKATADLCLLKRLSFEYEKEIRLLVMFTNSEPSGALLKLQIDPVLLIDGICFDPRLTKAERMERADLLRGTGLEEKVLDGDQYQGVALQIIVE